MALEIVAKSIHPSRFDAMVRDVASSFRACTAIPFLGAGISVDKPACLPPAGWLVPPLVEVFRKALRSTYPWSRYKLQDLVKARRILKNARMEQLLDVLHRTHGRTGLQYLDCLRGKTWNSHHACLAALAVAGHLPRCVTLNFDLLIEYALQASGLCCVTLCPLTKHRFSLLDDAHQTGPLVLKPHGSYLAKGDPYDALTATLSQVGARPSFKNIEAMEGICAKGATLIIAGYSDDDWDIYPIIQSVAHRFSHIFWFKYIPDETQERDYVGALLKEGAILQDEISADIATNPEFKTDAEFWSLTTRVIPWLREIIVPCTLVLGRSSEALIEVCNALDLPIPAVDGECNRPTIDASPFWPMIGAGADDARQRTLLALAALIRSSGVFARALLLALANSSHVMQIPELKWQIEHHLTHTDHTDGYLRSAVRHMRRVIAIKRRLRPTVPVTDDILWLGYEYLCLAKRPPLDRARKSPQPGDNLGRLIETLLWLLLIPYYLSVGYGLLRKSVRDADPARRDETDAKARYYWADLFHNWGTYLLLLGSKRLRFFRPYFKWVSRMYSRLATSSAGEELMSYDYYWMRKLEARLIADWGIPEIERAGIEKKLQEIEHRNRLVQDHVQRGNTFAYRALLEFYKPHADQNRVDELLQQAENVWIRAGGTMASGRRRVAVFHRLTGTLSLKATLAKISGQ